MSAIIQAKSDCLNQNIKNILKFLDKQYPNYGFDETEEDLKTGLVKLEDELFNMYSALNALKKYNDNNQKTLTAINLYIKMLMKENNKKY
jgi:hypothetical protein